MAINAKIDLKKPVLEEISAQVEGAQCVLLVNYSGLTVAQDTPVSYTHLTLPTKLEV